MEQLNHKLYELLINLDLSAPMAAFLNLLGLLVAAAILWYSAHVIARRLLSSGLGNIARRTSGHFDDYLLKHRAVRHFAQLIPLVLLMRTIPWILVDYPGYVPAAFLAADIYMTLLMVWIAKSVLFAGRDYLKDKDSFKDKPIESFAQVIVIILYFTAIVFVFSKLTGRSVLAFFTAMGAASAILLLIFKDTLLGFVASIQVSANDMVRIGDWITLDKYGADGDVVEINLTTVKIQNFDKTMTTIPTYYLISDSFKNWRSMQAEGGRRIKRAILVKISSIRYLSDDELADLKNISLLKSYITKRSQEISDYNTEHSFDKSLLINGRNLTNVGLFRAYIEEYLRRHPKIHPGLTMMVRQLAPTDRGMPIEIYAFVNDTRWVSYEHIMADIFDHLLAAVPYFSLEVFELPATGDFSARKVKPSYAQSKS